MSSKPPIASREPSTAANSVPGMHQVGVDMSGGRVADHRKLHEKRQRRGECPTCGIKLFKVGGVLGKKKTPLTIEGHVDKGRCLGCHPYKKPPKRPPTAPQQQSAQLLQANSSGVPQYLTITPKNRAGAGAGDEGTVISGITLDQHLLQNDDEYTEVTVEDPRSQQQQLLLQHQQHLVMQQQRQSDLPPPPPPTGPPTSALARGRTTDEDDRDTRPSLPPRRVSDNNNYSQSAQDLMMASPLTAPSGPSSTRPERGSSTQDYIPEEPASPLRRPLDGGPAVPEAVSTAVATVGSGGPREIFFDSSRLSSSLDTPGDMQLSNSNQNHNGRDAPPQQPQRAMSVAPTLSNSQEEITILPENLPADTAETTIAPRRRMPAGGGSMRFVVDKEHEINKNSSTNVFDADELRTLLASIAAGGDAPELATLEAITTHMWKGGKQARAVFGECKGFEALSALMWSHMTHEPLEERAVELFLASVASEREEGENGDTFEATAALATEEVRNAVEALLFVMQSLSHNEWVQVTSCRALVCLATASGLCEGQVDDGSNSGAAAVVLSSMSAHKTSLLVQTWCMRALYELCTISANSEANKRTLLTASSLEEGGTGLSPVLACLQAQVVEAVRLVWCLSASENARGTLDPSGSVLQMLIQMLRDNVASSSGVMIEALLGAINNLSVVADGTAVLSNPDELVQLAFQAAKTHDDNIGLCTEAIALIANIAAISPIDKEQFASAGGITFIGKLIMDNDDAEALHEEGACALLSLALGCESVKAAIRSPTVFAAVKRMSRLYESSVRWQEILCTLISSVVVTTDAQSEACERDAIGVICFAMTLHSGPEAERVQESCCSALRNLSCRETVSVKEHLVASDAVDLVVDAMSRHNESVPVMLNGSETLWNVGFSGQQHAEQSKMLVPNLLKAMRAHLDDVELLHSTLGVLIRSLIGSDVNKRRFCQDAGIEVATSIMLIHRESETLLIKSCGLLASLSCLPELVQNVVQGGGITVTVDTLCGQNPSTELLLSAAQFLTNAVLAMPTECDEVGRVMPVLIARMRECPQEVEFQSEACRLMWAVASLSETVRTKILALDGVAVLMATLENNKETDVQNNALEAFNELSQSSKQVSAT